MANLNIVASRAVLDRIVGGVALNFGYAENVPDPENPGETIPNPQSKDDFTKAKLIEVLRDWSASGEGQPEQQALASNNRQRRNEHKDLVIT